MSIAIVVLLALILFDALAFVGIRSSIVGERNRCDKAWKAVKAWSAGGAGAVGRKGR